MDRAVTHLELTTNVGIGGYAQLTQGQRVDALAWAMVEYPPRLPKKAKGPTGTKAAMRQGAMARLEKLRAEAGNG